MAKFATILALGALSAVLASTPARAEKLLGNYQDWSAFTDGASQAKVCYIASVPKKEEGDYASRGNTYVLVSHRPGEGARDVFELRAGYTYKTDSEVEVDIDGKKFKLFTKEGSAWARDPETDLALAKAMISGRAMVVKGTSARGTLTTDTYSLTGFTASYLAIGEACAVK